MKGSAIHTFFGFCVGWGRSRLHCQLCRVCMDGLSPEPFPSFRGLEIPSGFPSLPPIPLHCGGAGQPWNLSPTARTLANPPHKSARSVRIAADLGGMQGWRSLRAAALRNASPALCGLDRSQAGPRAAWKSIHGRVEAAHGECCSQEGQTESGEIRSNAEVFATGGQVLGGWSWARPGSVPWFGKSGRKLLAGSGD